MFTETLGSTMLVELRMRDDEMRAKQLVITTTAPKPQAAAQSYEAEYWTAQEWEEYEAEGAGASDQKGRQAQTKPKLCSEYASKEGCPKGA
eukprot:3164912-Amphidinium_carterae.1